MANPFDQFDAEPNPFDEPSLTAARAAELVTRGAAPAVTGALAGGAVAGAPGALIGSMALPIGDVINQLVNLAAGGVERVTGAELGRLGMPSQIVSQMMGQAGFAEPTSTTERVVEAVGGGLGMTGTQLPALARLVTEGEKAVTRNIAQQMGQAPVAQTAATVPASAAAQYVTEATGSPLAGMIAGMGVGAPFGVRTRKGEVAPNAEQLRAQASDAYARSAAAGALISPESIANAGQRIVQKVSNKIVIDPQVDTEAVAVQRRLTQAMTNPQSFEDLDLTRQFIRDAQAAGGRSGKFAKEALREFDNYIDNLSKNDLIVSGKQATQAAIRQAPEGDVREFVKNLSQISKGQADVAVKELKTARDLWKRSNKTQILEDILQSAELRATANYSQSGMENALRRKLVNLADSEDLKFFTKAEQDAIKAAAKGGKVQNFLRWAGKYAGTSPLQTGVGSGMGGAIGAMLGGPAGAAVGAATVPAVGGLARAGATQLGMQQIRQLQEMMALGRMPQTIRETFGAVPATTVRGLLSDEIPVPQEETNPFQ
jgi:hypothetical protein